MSDQHHQQKRHISPDTPSPHAQQGAEGKGTTKPKKKPKSDDRARRRPAPATDVAGQGTTIHGGPMTTPHNPTAYTTSAYESLNWQPINSELQSGRISQHGPTPGPAQGATSYANPAQNFGQHMVPGSTSTAPAPSGGVPSRMTQSGGPLQPNVGAPPGQSRDPQHPSMTGSSHGSQQDPYGRSRGVTESFGALAVTETMRPVQTESWEEEFMEDLYYSPTPDRDDNRSQAGASGHRGQPPQASVSQGSIRGEQRGGEGNLLRRANQIPGRGVLFPVYNQFTGTSRPPAPPGPLAHPMGFQQPQAQPYGQPAPQAPQAPQGVATQSSRLRAPAPGLSVPDRTLCWTLGDLEGIAEAVKSKSREGTKAVSVLYKPYKAWGAYNQEKFTVTESAYSPPTREMVIQAVTRVYWNDGPFHPLLNWISRERYPALLGDYRPIHRFLALNLWARNGLTGSIGEVLFGQIVDRVMACYIKLSSPTHAIEAKDFEIIYQDAERIQKINSEGRYTAGLYEKRMTRLPGAAIYDPGPGQKTDVERYWIPYTRERDRQLGISRTPLRAPRSVPPGGSVIVWSNSDSVSDSSARRQNQYKVPLHWYKVSQVADPEGYKTIDNRTFIVALNRSNPYRQILGDFITPENAPAAILCYPVDVDDHSENDPYSQRLDEKLQSLGYDSFPLQQWDILILRDMVIDNKVSNPPHWLTPDSEEINNICLGNLSLYLRRK